MACNADGLLSVRSDRRDALLQFDPTTTVFSSNMEVLQRFVPDKAIEGKGYNDM